MAKRNSGHPGSSGFAQSGGINHTFGGGKGGSESLKADTAGKKIGSGKLNNGLTYTTRSDGGDKSLKSKSFRVGAPPPVHPGGKGATATRKVSVRKPESLGGGSGGPSFGSGGK